MEPATFARFSFRASVIDETTLQYCEYYEQTLAQNLKSFLGSSNIIPKRHLYLPRCWRQWHRILCGALLECNVDEELPVVS
jgi:hypothetical protein